MKFINILQVVLLIIGLSKTMHAQSQAEHTVVERKKIKALGDSLLNEMYHYFVAKNTQKALSYADSTIFYFEKSSSYYSLAKTHYIIANLYYNNRQNELFRQHATIAWELTQKHLKPTSPLYPTIACTSSLSEKISGNIEKALTLLNFAIESFKAIIASTTDQVKIRSNEQLLAQQLNLKGNIFKDKEDLEEAERYYKEALQLLLKNDAKKDLVAVLYKELAILESLRGATNQSVKLYQQCLHTIESAKDHKKPYFQTIKLYCLQGLAQIYLAQEDYQQAAPFVVEAVAITESLNIQFDASVSYSLCGKYAAAKGEMRKAKDYYHQALEAAKEEYSNTQKHPKIATAYYHLGKQALHEQERELALDYFHQAIVSSCLSFDEKDYYSHPGPADFILPIEGVDLLYQKGIVMQAQYAATSELRYLREAFKAFQAAVATAQFTRQNYYSTQAKLKLNQKAVAVYESAIAAAYQLYQQTAEAAYLQKIFELIEQNKARVLLESLAEQEALGLSGMPDTLLTRGRKLKQDLYYYRQSLALYEQQENIDQRIVANTRSSLFQIEEAYQAWEKTISATDANYQRLKRQVEQPALLTIQQEYLKENTALIEYFFGKEHIYVFSVAKHFTTIEALPIHPSLETELQSVLMALQQTPSGSMEDIQSFHQSAYFLYDQLLANALNKLPAEIEELTLIPDDVLSLLPFEILLTKAGPGTVDLPYLMKQYTVHYNYSSALLLSDSSGPKLATSGVLGIAPSFGSLPISDQRNCDEATLYDLRCSSKEIDGIQSLLTGIGIKGQAATKAAFKEHAPNFNVLHLATHACTNHEHPMLNQIWFADGPMSNYELFNLELQADLAVLSACNTGSGQLSKGEGVQSLARGFLHAGCKSLVTSLWSVDDCATSKIMHHFYTQLKAGKTKNVALRQAKLTYLEESNKLQRHPYYWAAFVLVGDVSELDGDDGMVFWWIGGGMVLLLLLFKFLKQKKNVNGVES